MPGPRHAASAQAASRAWLAAAALAPFVGALSGLPSSASAENLWSVYSGTSFTRDSDLHITGPGTDLRLRGVQWDADPFKPAPYYGLRFSHFFDARPQWGFSVDYTHYKMYARTDRTVQADGTWKGAAVNGAAPMQQYVQHFEISHGVNMLSVNGLYRWTDIDWLDRRLQPYVGIGLAYYRPHSENTVDNVGHETGYDNSGFGYQALAGLALRFTQHIGMFIETKYNHGNARVGIAGGEAETPLRSFHAIAGLSYHF